eukprot:gene26973-biopygen17547
MSRTSGAVRKQGTGESHERTLDAITRFGDSDNVWARVSGELSGP